ncbi:MAG TPA: HD domain-containing protein [Rhizobacter sp.]|nr:HD domain-containing protein [Rhizobacter sp.]
MNSYSIEDIENLFLRFGNEPYDGLPPEETVTTLEHALQCAQLAEWSGADDSLVAAAFLHDLGKFVADDSARETAHELRALPHLSDMFSAQVLEPIRLHRVAKRYLAATEPAYLKGLSPTAMRALELQGGPMTSGEVTRFEATPYAREAVQLRRWHDAAKVPGQRTPSLDYYLALLEDLKRQAADRDKLEVGPQTVS